MSKKGMFKIIFIAIISTTLLVGCSGERDKALNSAKSAYATGDYVKAREFFEQAGRLGALDSKDAENKKMYEETLNKLYVHYYKSGDNFREGKDFKKALENYNNANNISSHDPNLNEAIKQTNSLIVEQERLDNYMKFVNSVFSDSNEILRGFNNELNSKVIGSISAGEFKNKVKSFVSKSNGIVAEIDNSFTTVEGDITFVHQELLNLIQYQHNTFVLALNVETSTDELSERYIEVKKQQTELINNLQSYADDKEIKYNSSVESKK